MAAGGGGAWKVAYADFVTAMMAFFLVMWICGQDQTVRHAVSYYFNDPYSASKIGLDPRPGRFGSVVDKNQLGMVPESERAALAQGRKSHTSPNGKATATKLISAWIRSDPQAVDRWREQARQARIIAQDLREVKDKHVGAEKAAAMMLAKRMCTELSTQIASEAAGIQQDLLFEAMDHVNWLEIAEDLLGD